MLDVMFSLARGSLSPVDNNHHVAGKDMSLSPVHVPYLRSCTFAFMCNSNLQSHHGGFEMLCLLCPQKRGTANGQPSKPLRAVEMEERRFKGQKQQGLT